MLAVPLAQDQVDAACRFHEQLDQWRLSDAALLRLQDSGPGFDAEACLLKCVTINTLYGTQVFAIVRMADHVRSVLARTDMNAAGQDLVEHLGALPAGEGETKRRFISFASKFCHFFIDEERFPIYDDAAKTVLKLHLGREVQPYGAKPYEAFCRNLERLRNHAGITGPGRHMDRYLWITGMYMKWLKERHKPKNKQQTNVELRRHFEHPTPVLAAELDVLLSSILHKPLKGDIPCPLVSKLS